MRICDETVNMTDLTCTL